MKKFFSVTVGLVVGLLSFLIISYAYKAISSVSTSTISPTSTFINRSTKISGMNLGSGAINFGSGGRPGMMGSGNFLGGTGQNGSVYFRRGSGVIMGTGRKNSDTGQTISAEELFNQTGVQ